MRWLAMRGQFALDGIDGMYRVADSLIAVQNGTAPERVIRFSTDASASRVISENVVERSTTTLGVPTHGVIVEGTLYYIANSGWDVLDASGKVEPTKTMSAAIVMRVNIRSP